MNYPRGTKYLIGIDEVGRGPLAGPVTLCAFCVPTKNLKKVQKMLSGITDSKKLSAKKREVYAELAKRLRREGVLRFSIANTSSSEIDEKGLSYAISNGIQRVLKSLRLPVDQSYIYLDGGLYADSKYQQETIIKGDLHNWLISSASVIAKTHRDTKMIAFAEKYPRYGFERHMGYGTKEHRENIKKHGVCDIHRKSFIH